MQPQNQRDNLDYPGSFRQEIADGLLYAHSRLNANTSKTLEAASFLHVLIELLSDKGLITVEELDKRKRAMGQRMGKLIMNRHNS